MADDLPNTAVTQPPAAPAPAPAPAHGTQPRGLGGFFKDLLLGGSPPPSGTVSRADTPREVVETVVFVVVLVLLLKSFVAEAFVIPTGSMAETLWGYQKSVACPSCGHKFPLNCSKEVEENEPAAQSCVCPNCRLSVEFGRGVPMPSCNAGDRVLVAKFLYDLIPGKIQPLDVVVFKYPEGPQKNWIPMNYIKRLIGLPGDTIGILHGDLFRARDLPYNPADDTNPEVSHRVFRDKYATELGSWDWSKGRPPFEQMRKPPDKMLALRRLVFDNEAQPRDLIEAGGWQPRWAVNGGWQAVERGPAPKVFRHEAGEEMSWLRYRHLLQRPPLSERPSLITDFMGYDTGAFGAQGSQNWVSDLMLEFRVKVEKNQGDLTVELSKGPDRFRARWALATGECQLLRVGPGGKETVLATKPTPLGKPGEYRVRFANFDRRLTVWVDRNLAFGDGVDYDPPLKEVEGKQLEDYAPTMHDLEPASVGAAGGAAFAVSQLRLWRDTYYTNPSHNPDGSHLSGSDWATPERWVPLGTLKAQTFYVQPGHYLCLGDNSGHSSDSRIWVSGAPGLVPERHMLGRALSVYWPVSRFGAIE